MSYILEKPYTQKQRNDFIVEYNHNLALKIVENENALFALEPNEIFIDGEIIVDENYEAKVKARERELLNKLTMTKADFWIALIDKGITKSMVREKLNLIPDETLRAKTIIRFDDAEKYWRGDPSMDILGNMFEITPEDLDYLFQNGKLPDEILQVGGSINE